MHLDLLRNYLAQHATPGDAAAGPAVSRRTALALGAAATGTVAALAGSERVTAGGASRRPDGPRRRSTTSSSTTPTPPTSPTGCRVSTARATSAVRSTR